MTGIYKNNGILRVILSFAEKGQFRRKSHFRSPLRNAFRSCEMDAHVLRSGTRVPKMVSQLRNPLPNGVFPAKWRISCFGGSQLRNGGSCAAKWHSCAKLDFVAAKISTENSNELRNGLAAKCLFP